VLCALGGGGEGAAEHGKRHVQEPDNSTSSSAGLSMGTAWFYTAQPGSHSTRTEHVCVMCVCHHQELECPFKHSLDDVKECNMYKLGFCIYGNHCRYKHTKCPGEPWAAAGGTYSRQGLATRYIRRWRSQQSWSPARPLWLLSPLAHPSLLLLPAIPPSPPPSLPTGPAPDPETVEAAKPREHRDWRKLLGDDNRQQQHGGGSGGGGYGGHGHYGQHQHHQQQQQGNKRQRCVCGCAGWRSLRGVLVWCHMCAGPPAVSVCLPSQESFTAVLEQRSLTAAPVACCLFFALSL
jgi:hypothetical protein